MAVLPYVGIPACSFTFWVSSWTRNYCDSEVNAQSFLWPQSLLPLRTEVLQLYPFPLPQQGPDEAAILQEEKKKKSLQAGGLSSCSGGFCGGVGQGTPRGTIPSTFLPEQQLVQLTQQLAQTEQHLNNLMTQLDPLFER